MSRIGKKSIILPASIKATIESDKVVISNSKSSLLIHIPEHVHVTQEAGMDVLNISVDDAESTKERALWGLIRQLLNNAVQGLVTPYQKALEFVGVGFKVALENRTLVMDVGYSHPVRFVLPDGIDVKVEKQIVTLFSADKGLIGETAARIRCTKPPEPYKGKGIKYINEIIRRKAGKTAKTTA